MLGIAIMMNNYFHDLATALLIASSVVVYFLAVAAEKTDNREVIRYFTDSYRRLTILARISLVWILAAGVIRIISFRDYEWMSAVDKNLVAAIIIKHILIFTLVGGGIYVWRRLSRKVKDLQQRYELTDEKSPDLSRDSSSVPSK